ncbi:MarR family winged helix-turn-helix transcriptional regulator [Gymnodinialimonas hymeniacidonis]|uniref:MarR family winged helix-turn-helix transcriptional regulator n=1 Tax=Gymnodinialimonas hymeniacidonis TaxID=3126508 RepID=UPI0034C607EC
MEAKSLSAPHSIGRQLNFAASTASAVCNQLLEPHGLTLAQWAVLVVLWRNGEASVKDIAALTGNAPPAASRIVDRMVAADLVERRQNPTDRRAVSVALTEKGEGLRPLHDIYEQVNAVMLADLSEAEAETLFALLARVQASGRNWMK